ncbi:hypothetical protein BGX33_005866 [Mortierella sp. NVP41]|nr:hypothetical protein BGX33_005866 [Mortierella sp. NVP41]
MATSAWPMVSLDYIMSVAIILWRSDLIRTIYFVLLSATVPSIHRMVSSGSSDAAQISPQAEVLSPQEPDPDLAPQFVKFFPVCQSRITPDPFSQWIEPAAPSRVRKLHPFLVDVPPEFTFRVRVTSHHQYTEHLYDNIALSYHGFVSLMQRLQVDVFPDQKELLDFADQILQGLVRRSDINDDDKEPKTRTDDTNLKPMPVPVYTGLAGDDVVLTPWDMVHAAQIAVHLGEPAVDLHFREIDLTKAMAANEMDCGERLIYNRPFSHRLVHGEALINANAGGSAIPSEGLIERPSHHRHPLIPSRRHGFAAIGLGISTTLVFYPQM